MIQDNDDRIYKSGGLTRWAKRATSATGNQPPLCTGIMPSQGGAFLHGLFTLADDATEHTFLAAFHAFYKLEFAPFRGPELA